LLDKIIHYMNEAKSAHRARRSKLSIASKN